MKTLRAFIVKEFRHILRDYRTLMVLIGMPLAQVLLFGYAITTEIHHAAIAVYDESGDALSRQLVAQLDASPWFSVQKMLHGKDEIHRTFRQGDVRVVVHIPPHFGRDAHRSSARIQLIADGSEPNVATTLVSYLNGVVRQFSIQHKLIPKTPMVITPVVRSHYNAELKSVFLFVPGVITVILMLISAMLTAIALTREKEMGNLEVLLVSPLRPPVIVIGKVIPYLILSLINASFVLSLGYWVFGVPLRGSLLLLAGESMLFIICALSLGILISTVSTSQQMALMLSLFALMLPTILLSGFIFPIDSMPWPLQWLSAVIPARYFNEIIKAIMLKGSGINLLWQNTAILAGMSAFFIMVSVRKFKIRLQ